MEMTGRKAENISDEIMSRCSETSTSSTDDSTTGDVSQDVEDGNILPPVETETAAFY